ncbi:hypothetical protein [Nocardia sp. NPDC052566]|uniref:hypothetical protein n=1 Tax=Nocardia sp. NPDC052566 TaxID=3364330 RepID=UPI0037C9C0FA
MTDFLHDPSAVIHWLGTHRDQFYAELVEHLDIEAGLEEVLLAERHRSLIEEVHDKLDIEAGLAAILPTPLLPLPDAAQQPHAPGTLEWASDELARMPLPIRLALRGDYAAKCGFAAREVTTLLSQPTIELDQLETLVIHVQTLLPGSAAARWRIATDEEIRADDGLSKDQKHALLRALKDEGRQAFLDAHAIYEVLDGVRKAVSDITDNIEDETPQHGVDNVIGFGSRKAGESTELEVVPVTDFAAISSMHRWTGAVADYVRDSFRSIFQGMSTHHRNQVPDVSMDDNLSIDWAPYLAEPLNQLASYLVCLEQMLNDFIGADLRKVDLAGVPLEGLRWSEQTTQWPDLWREQIRQDSVRIDDDVYEIHYGTHTRGRNTMV